MSEENTIETEAQESPTITLNDLTIYHNIIQVACERGAFKANEMSSVGVAYDKLHLFLEKIREAAESAEADATDATGETPVEEVAEEAVAEPATKRKRSRKKAA